MTIECKGIVAGLLGIGLSTGALGQPALPVNPPHTVSVRGTAHQEIEPEKVDLLLTYRFSDNVKESERTQEQESDLQAVMQKAGIPPDKLVLDELSATGYGGFSKTGNTSVALTKIYRLTLNNPKMLNELIPKLVKTGADNLRVVNLESTRLEATKLEVAGQAAADARQKAQLVVKQAGGQLGGVVTIVEVLPESYGPEPLYPGRYSSDKYAKAKSISLEESVEIATPNLRKIKVQATFDVVFEIK